jgi:hypothetical protein
MVIADFTDKEYIRYLEKLVDSLQYFDYFMWDVLPQMEREYIEAFYRATRSEHAFELLQEEEE